jgi:hypothetical protein
VARNSQPIVNGGSNPASFERRLSPALMARNQQQNAVAGRDGLFERPVDRFPCPVKAMAMKVQRPIGIDLARPQAAVPSAVESGAVMGNR